VHVKFNIITTLSEIPKDDKIELLFIVNGSIVSTDIVNLSVDKYYSMSATDYINKTIQIAIKSNNCYSISTPTKLGIKTIQLGTFNNCFLYTNEALITAPLILTNVNLNQIFISNINLFVDGIQNTNYTVVINSLGTLVITYPSLSANQVITGFIEFQQYGDTVPFSHIDFTTNQTDNLYCS
jgi:hypothetical protein